MAENPFVEKIASLKAGEISELIVEHRFSNFVMLGFLCADRAEIVGEAGLNGRIIYRYQKEEEYLQNITKFKQKVLCKIEKNGNLRN